LTPVLKSCHEGVGNFEGEAGGGGGGQVRIHEGENDGLERRLGGDLEPGRGGTIRESEGLDELVHGRS